MSDVISKIRIFFIYLRHRTNYTIVNIWQQNFGHHCFKQLLVNNFVQSQYLKQWLWIVNWTTRNKFLGVLIKIKYFTWRKFIWICVHNGGYLGQLFMWIWSTMVHLMSSCLFSIKPLPGLLDHWGALRSISTVLIDYVLVTSTRWWYLNHLQFK